MFWQTNILEYLAVLDGDHVTEVVFDRLHAVDSSDDIGRLLSNHHLGRVRVATHRARHD